MKLKLVLLVGVVLLCPLAGYSAPLPCYQAVQACSAFANDWYVSCVLLGDYDCLKRAQALYDGCLTAHGCPPSPNASVKGPVREKETFSLPALAPPTLLDRSDYGNNCELPLNQRVITAERLNYGFVQGVVAPDSGSSVGLVDFTTSDYPECNEFGERFFSISWLVTASLSSVQGLAVIEAGVVVFAQQVPYAGEAAEIRVENSGNLLAYYLNDELVYQSLHPGLGARDLRGYYFGAVTEPLVDAPDFDIPIDSLKSPGIGLLPW